MPPERDKPLEQTSIANARIGQVIPITPAELAAQYEESFRLAQEISDYMDSLPPDLPPPPYTESPGFGADDVPLKEAVGAYKESLKSGNAIDHDRDFALWNQITKELGNETQDLTVHLDTLPKLLKEFDDEKVPLPVEKRDYLMERTMTALARTNDPATTVDVLKMLLPPKDDNRWRDAIWHDYFNGLHDLGVKNQPDATFKAMDAYTALGKDPLTDDQKVWQRSLGGAIRDNLNDLAKKDPTTANDLTLKLLQDLKPDDPLFTSVVTFAQDSRHAQGLPSLDIEKVRAEKAAADAARENRTLDASPYVGHFNNRSSGIVAPTPEGVITTQDPVNARQSAATLRALL